MSNLSAADLDANAEKYELLRLAFEGYIRDRMHRVVLTDADVKEVIDEWLSIAEEVQDVE